MNLKTDRFYLPYQFVSVTGQCNGKPVQRAVRHHVADGECAPGQIGAGARHDIWLRGHHSGRVVCRITTETPTFIGAMRNAPPFPARVSPALDAEGRRMLPGNSLRGMVGSLIEALSQSALRVLDNKPLTRSAYPGNGTEEVPGSVYAAFTRLGLLTRPYHSGRVQLTPAELLLGVVSADGDHDSKESNPLPALASRLRFADGRLITPGSVEESEVPLQILSNPKAKSPAFYFSGGKARRKSLDLSLHDPNGRKFYLHHPKEQLTQRCYVTNYHERKLDDQKVIVAPIRRDVQFEFHIDYDNLSKPELHLLLSALRPAPEFRHRLGMGKPLGLGSVRLDVLGVFEVDRAKRYRSDALGAPRYAAIYVDPSMEIIDTRRYQQEHAERAAAKTTIAFSQGKTSTWQPDVTLVDAGALAQLLVIGARAGGNPSALEPGIPVCYQRTRKQLDQYVLGVTGKGDGKMAENELFGWVVANEKASRYQYLQRVQPNAKLKPFNSQ